MTVVVVGAGSSWVLSFFMPQVLHWIVSIAGSCFVSLSVSVVDEGLDLFLSCELHKPCSCFVFCVLFRIIYPAIFYLAQFYPLASALASIGRLVKLRIIMTILMLDTQIVCSFSLPYLFYSHFYRYYLSHSVLYCKNSIRSATGFVVLLPILSFKMCSMDM